MKQHNEENQDEENQEYWRGRLQVAHQMALKIPEEVPATREEYSKQLTATFDGVMPLLDITGKQMEKYMSVIKGIMIAYDNGNYCYSYKLQADLLADMQRHICKPYG